MADVSCATCVFGTPHNNKPLGGLPGLNRITCHHAASPSYGDDVSNRWFCSEHPLAPGQRDRIAELAMHAQVSNSGWVSESKGWSDAHVARNAYEQADAMMAERAKGCK
jgi:hypothetical protein